MIAAPAITPITSATCCFHGVASTSWPVFRSCRLLLAMVATANTTAVTNSAKATSACWPLAADRALARRTPAAAPRRSPPGCRCPTAGCWRSRSARPCSRRPRRRRSSSARCRPAPPITSTQHVIAQAADGARSAPAARRSAPCRPARAARPSRSECPARCAAAARRCRRRARARRPWPKRRPAITGLTSLASVQTAATPMVPAPTKRTLWLQVG